jgi:hypothetical protein
MAWQSLVSLGFLTVEASRSHSDTPQEVRFLWTSDQPIPETLSNTRQSQETDILAAGRIRTRNPIKRAALDRDRQDRRSSSQFTRKLSVLCAVSTWWTYGPQVVCVRPHILVTAESISVKSDFIYSIRAVFMTLQHEQFINNFCERILKVNKALKLSLSAPLRHGLEQKYSTTHSWPRQ